MLFLGVGEAISRPGKWRSFLGAGEGVIRL
jgi:hypothetical protein